jgi:hypothetical protein
LRLLPGSLSGGCHRRRAELRIRHRNPRGAALFNKDKLLANGDRWEREIARNMALDAPYR